MKQNIQIEKPCSENFGAMTNVAGGKFCGSCQTKVIDFTRMSLDEIQNFFAKQQSEKICGRYNARHTNESKGFDLINKVESFIFKTRFRKMAVWTFSVIFFLLNSYKCMGKRVEPVRKNEKKTMQTDTLQSGSKNK